MKNFLKQIVIRLLEIESSLVLKKYKPHIIAVTGNVGKTSTKDAIAIVLAKKFFIRESDKSFNSEIGVPLTILDCKNAWNNPFLWIKNLFEGLFLIVFPNNYPACLVLEIGTDKPGDIKRIVKWLKPNIVIVNKIGLTPVHVEFFSSVDELIAEKCSLVKALDKGGTLIVNSDDENSMKALLECSGPRQITFGISEGSTFRASNYHITYDEHTNIPTGITFKLDYMGNSIPIRLRSIFGRQNIYPALASIAVGVSMGMNLVEAVDALSYYKGPKGRLNFITGINDSIIFDDTYNSSPAAVLAALKFLSELSFGSQKICVLGDMLELGKYTIDSHKNIGKEAAKVCQKIYLVGHRARDIGLGALEAGFKEEDLFYFDDSVSAGKEIREKVHAGDVILIKGSQRMRMERIVEQVMKYPEKKSELLVRQEKEWQNR